MEHQIVMPDMPGQICRILTQLNDEKSDDVFIVTGDPLDFDDGDNIDVVSLREIQRNISNPQSALKISVKIKDLAVVAQNLEEYIKSWNNF